MLPGTDGRRYRIVRRLGAGGMAEVFEAVLSGEHGFTRRVAIKRLTAQAGGDDLIRRFLDEARIASKLHHAGIVGVLDYGVVDDMPFQVLEFVDGLDAEELIVRAGGRLPEDIAMMLAADVAHALDHAHHARDDDDGSLGIVHRDVKPSNVLVSWAGDVKLSDFGIAVARGRLAQTEAGMARGTPSFMAPEQRTLSPIDGRTDVFALGCTLHAMLTGVSPIENMAVSLKVIAGDPAPLDPGLPGDVAAVIARACAPAPGDRYASAGALADALGPLVASRLARDARGRLREFLDGLRAPIKPRAGLFDQLLAIELVPVDQPGSGSSPRQFTLRPDAAPAKVEPDADRATTVPTTPVGPPRRKRRLVAWVIGAVLVAAGAGGIAIAVRHDRAGPVVVAAAPSPDASVAAVDASIADAPAPIMLTMDAAAPPIDARHSSSRDRDGRGKVATTTIDAAVPPPPPPTGTGYLRIPGEKFANADILVDGHHEGYAPIPIAVSIGRHRLEVVMPDGTHLKSIAIEITERNTLSHPLIPYK